MKIHDRYNNADDKRILSNELDTEIKDGDYIIGYHNDDGYLIVCFTNYTLNTDVEIYGHGSGKWFHPEIYNHIFTHCFKTLGCLRVTLKVEADNHKCIELLKKGGAVKECELRGLNVHLYSLLPKDLKVK